MRLDVASSKINPADDAENEWKLGGQRQQPLGFLQRLSRLNCDASLETKATHLHVEVFREKIAASECIEASIQAYSVSL